MIDLNTEYVSEKLDIVIEKTEKANKIFNKYLGFLKPVLIPTLSILLFIPMLVLSVLIVTVATPVLIYRQYT